MPTSIGSPPKWTKQPQLDQCKVRSPAFLPCLKWCRGPGVWHFSAFYADIFSGSCFLSGDSGTSASIHIGHWHQEVTEPPTPLFFLYKTKNIYKISEMNKYEKHKSIQHIVWHNGCSSLLHWYILTIKLMFLIAANVLTILLNTHITLASVRLLCFTLIFPCFLPYFNKYWNFFLNSSSMIQVKCRNIWFLYLRMF